MTITATHVPAIVALIAGILILIMPRLLNFIVAIYLIFVGAGRPGPVALAHICSAWKRGFRGLRGTPQNGVRRASSFPLSGLL